MSTIGERDLAVERLRAEREAHVAEIEKQTKLLTAQHAKLAKAKKKLENPSNLKNLTVTWEQDGVEHKIGPLAEATPLEFFRAVDAIPRSVRAKADGNRLKEVEQLRGELNAIPMKYRNMRRDLETKIYRCDVRIAQLLEE